MALVLDSVSRSNVVTCLVQRYGFSKAGALAAMTALEGDTVTWLLLPNADSWANVAQIANAAARKAQGMTPIYLGLIFL